MRLLLFVGASLLANGSMPGLFASKLAPTGIALCTMKKAVALAGDGLFS
ncbi:hypothetical protein [Pseudomonas sp. Pseusp97]